jgi:uncharacterized protein involved in exopolysaccharide biosynthesis
MSIIQFFRILWARKWMILAAAGSCVAGGIVVLLVLPPRWEAHARIMLSTLKPDPITGQVFSGAATMTYVDTQTELIRDYSVAGQIPAQVGWLSDPDLIARYQQSAKKSGQDFPHWAAQLVIERTKAALVEGSNILEITYSASDPNEAKIIADHLRRDYIDTSLSLRRNEALRNMQWYDAQAQKSRDAMLQAQSVLAAYERENGVLMAGDKEDVDSAQLRALTNQAVTSPITTVSSEGTASFTAQLADLDSQISALQQKLGPNHPQLQALRTRRKSLAELAGKEQSAQAQAANAAAANATALQRAVQAQKARVIGNSDKIGKLRELQTKVDLAQDQYNKTLARAGELGQEAAAADAGVTPLGPATVANEPAFPKKPLIIIGSIGLGLAMGVMSALLAELLARRLRSPEDLQNAIDVPLLAVIPAERLRRGGRRLGLVATETTGGSLARA